VSRRRQARPTQHRRPDPRKAISVQAAAAPRRRRRKVT